MKKLIFFMIVLLFATVLSAETLYYYVEGKKVFLTEDFSSYSFIRTSVTKANFVLPQSVKIIKKHKNVSIIETTDASAKENLAKNGALFPAYLKDGVKIHVSGMISVKIPGQPDDENAEKWCKKNGLNFIKHHKYTPDWYLVSFDGNPIKKAAELVEKKIVEAAEPSFFIPLRKRAYIPNDPLFKNQWHLHNDGTDSSVSGSDHAHVAEAWEVLKAFKGNIGGKGVNLAIIDDGFDLDHEDFTGRFTNGYDFADNDNDPTYENGWNPNYSDMHGTCCAGVAGAATDNGKGVSGACPECTLIPIRMDMNTYSLDDAAYESFEWAADHGADIISNSWGPADNGGAVDMNTKLKNLVENLATKGRNGKGIIILFAAGNGAEDIDGVKTKDGFAGNSNVFAIGATNAQGMRVKYSDYGQSLDFMTPSQDFQRCQLENDYYGQYLACDGDFDGIWTIDNTGEDGYNSGNYAQGDKKGNYTNDFGGTSSACPLAAGITGLVLSANPNLTRYEVYQIYVETSDKVGGVTYSYGFNEKYGYGRINACEAVKMALDLAGEDVSLVTCGGEVINPDPIDDTDTGDTSDSGDSTDTSDTANTGDTADSGDSTDTTDTANTADTADSTDTTPENPPDTADSADTDTPDTADTSSDTDTAVEGICGNRIVEDNEQCDDGNTINGDGCSEYCMFEEDRENEVKRKSNDGCSMLFL